MRYIFIIVVMAFACGCASFGAECGRYPSPSAHYKVVRFGWGISDKQMDKLAKFKSQVCPGH